MGTSNQVTQNGNTSQTWVLSGGDVSNHDVIVVRLDNTTPDTSVEISHVRIGERVNQQGGVDPIYSFDITVVGPGAVAFRIDNQGV